MQSGNVYIECVCLCGTRCTCPDIFDLFSLFVLTFNIFYFSMCYRHELFLRLVLGHNSKHVKECPIKVEKEDPLHSPIAN